MTGPTADVDRSFRAHDLAVGSCGECGKAGVELNVVYVCRECWEAPICPARDCPHAAENDDLNVPVDEIHAMCADAIWNIRRTTADARARIGVEAAAFQAEIDRICATGGRDGWDRVRDLAARDTT